MADGIIFGLPTFMGGIAGKYKLFLEEMAYRGYSQQQKLVNKMATSIANKSKLIDASNIKTTISFSLHFTEAVKHWSQPPCPPVT
tara:strand:- start:3111 stop:3365 length:255 start_codon:yes stop_codon:yes gene_type:complete